MKTVAVANRKGGVGKSTVTVHIAAGLANRGYNILLIDTDPQGHAGFSLGVPSQPGLFNLLVEKQEFTDVVRAVEAAAYSAPDSPPAGRLFVLPSDERTGVIPMLEKNPFAFLNRLEEVSHIFDYILIDTAPTTTMFDGAVYMAAQAFLYVTECEALSFDGLRRGLAQIQEFAQQRQTYNMPENHTLGIVPNKYRQNTENRRRNLLVARKAFGNLVWQPIPLRTVLSEATNFKQAVFAYAPDTRETQVMWQLVDQFEKAVTQWQNVK